MKSFLRLLQFQFLPRSVDLALLVLRLWLGLTLVLNHGLAKLTGFSGMVAKFPDPLGVGTTASLSLVVFAEVVCAILIAVGLVTRFATLVVIIELCVAFLLVHHRAMSGAGSGELAFIYLAGFVALFLVGPGKFSVDRKLGAAA